MLAMDDLRRVIMMMPKDLREVMTKNKIYLAGGSIRDIVAGNEISDWDIFGENKDFLKMVCNSFVGTRKPDARLYTTKNAFTVLSPRGKPIQAIHRWLYSDPVAVMNDFDFSMCAVVVWHEGGGWHSKAHPYFYADLAAKRLRYIAPQRDEDAGGSMLRMVKFIRRGYSISPENMAKIMARLTKQMRDTNVLDQHDGHERVLTSLLREVDPLTVIEGLELRDPFADPLLSTNDLDAGVENGL
jgi:hypothetical protein